ncbi:hybrid sensor histidine kinase/response regulator [Loktanella sp. S4079]|uniref:hybrid sensor histidine kinase/response regulator n=1 Tax=Loktanella sp. S4079 TaxID=579483 RepID=UPI00061F3C86|nr:PAS domain-containing protein [Loktanella sp. S4079]KJZ17931.1 hypothetical protein TW80_16485 [Loktanella sp. S4079]
MCLDLGLSDELTTTGRYMTSREASLQSAFGTDLSTIFFELLNQISEGLLITDAPSGHEGHRIFFVNDALAKMMGYTPDELIGASPLIFQGEQSDKATMELVAAAKREGIPFVGKIVNYNKRGEPIHVLWKLNPVFSAEGEVIAWLSLKEDLSTKLDLEVKAVDVNNRLGRLIETMGDGVLFWDTASGSVVWSDHLKSLLGLHGQQIPPTFTSYINCVIPEDRNRVNSTIRRSASTGKPFDVQHRIEVASGEQKTLWLRGQPTDTSGTRSERYVVVVRDITDQMKAERRLLQAEEIANIGSWEIDLIQNTLYWSPQVFRIHGFEPNSFQPTVEWAIESYHPDHRNMVQTAVNDAIEHGVPFQFEAVIVRPDGTERNVLSEGFVDFTNEGKPRGLFGVFIDRTDIKAKEDVITKTQRMDALGKFVGGVAHDFNNLLAVIMGNLEALEETTQTDNEKRRVKAALKATEHGAELTHSLLAFVKKSPMRISNVNIVEQIEGMMPLMRRVLPSNITISLTRLNTDVWVLCDATILEACILNLVVNARDALPDGGKVVINVEKVEIDEHANAQLGASVAPGHFAAISVNDNGTGMSSQQLHQAQEPFFTTKAGGVNKGTGLGLPRVLGFAEQSNGIFRLYSEPGKGTSAKIILPLSKNRGAPVKPLVSNGTNYDSIRGKRVLLVEDQQAVLEILEDVITSIGLDVEIAISGDDAYNRFGHDFSFSLVVTDVVMPGELQGPDLVQKLRSDGASFSAIYISGYMGDSSVSNDEMGEFDIKLTKPVTKKALAQAILEALSTC